MKKLISYLEKEYGLIGLDQVLIEKALTTKSFTKEKYDRGEMSSPDGFDYQELELIGDKVIGLVVAEHLLLVGTKTEGKLTTEISSIVDNENLGKISNQMRLYQYVNKGNNQQIIGTKIESDILESLVGAIYYSLGFLSTKRFVISVLMSNNSDKELQLISGNEETIPKISFLTRIAEEQNKKQDIKLDHVKNSLQEYCQKRGYPIPEYKLIDKQGLDHNPTFTVVVYVNGEILGSGISSSKKAAEKMAAATAYSVVIERKDSNIY